jgi:hypothetical protein
MLRRIVNVAMVTILVVTALTSLALAGASGPENPMAPSDDYVMIEPEEMHWYAFTYDYDEDNKIPLAIKLFSDQIENAVLTVHTQNEVELWARDGEMTHVGCCTAVDRDLDHDGSSDYALWSALPETSGTYYIVVEVAEGSAEPLAYRFEVTGEKFTMLGEEVAPEPAAMATTADVEVVPTMATVPEKAPMAVTGLMGSSPFFALAVSDEWVELAPGGQHWYAFNYDFDEDWTKMPEIRFETNAINDVLLTIHNGQQAREWELGEELEHFGCCTVVDEDEDDDNMADYAMWTGGLRSSGRYYIVVEAPEDLDGSAFYRFELTGEGIQ